jgi:hypothetical protein
LPVGRPIVLVDRLTEFDGTVSGLSSSVTFKSSKPATNSAKDLPVIRGGSVGR